MSDGPQAQVSSKVRWRPRRRDRLEEIHDMLVRLDTALIVRDPGSARSADAYEGLRRQVVAAAGDRRRHVVVLTQLAESIRAGEDIAAISLRCEEWLMQASIQVVDAPDPIEAFDVVGDGDGPVTVTVPAYVDATTGAVVRRGIAERASVEPQPSQPSAEETVAPTPVEGDDH